MEAFVNLGAITSAIGVLVVLVNIVTEVLKKATWNKLPTNILAVVISLVFTLASFFAYCEMKSLTITWYMVFGAIVVGFMVSYAAMFGYDKLKEVLASIQSK